MNCKRFRALKRIFGVVVRDLGKWESNARIGQSYYQLISFARWLGHMLAYHRDDPDACFPLPYFGYTKQSPFINKNRSKWKYLIEFNELIDMHSI